MQINVKVTGTDKVRAMLQRIGPALAENAMAQTAVKVEDYIRAEAGQHLKTGALNSSIFNHRAGDGSYEIGHDLQHAPHAEFVLFGTKPHPIYPKGASLATQRELYGPNGTQRKRTADGKLMPMPKGRKLVLRFPMGGKFRFAQFVNHPGYKGDDWIKRAAAIAPQIFAKAVEDHLKNITG